MEELQKYVPMIDAIITVSNPDEVSPKKIRKAVQELFGVDLENKRKLVNKLIVERFYDIQSKPRIWITEAQLKEKDEALAKALTQNKQPRVKQEKEPRIKKKRNLRNPNPNSITVRKMQLSDKLQEFLGEAEMPRTQVVKKVWEYIKENDLQNPKDRREILCDEKMKPVFGNKMTMFQLNKILANHIFKNDKPSSPENENSEENDDSENEDSKVKESSSSLKDST